MENTVKVAPNFMPSSDLFAGAVACRMDDVGNRLLHRRDPVGRGEDRPQNAKPERVDARAVADILTLDLLPEGGQQLPEGAVMDVAEVDEKIGRGHQAQVRGGDGGRGEGWRAR